MYKEDYTELIKLPAIYYLDNTSRIGLSDSYTEIAEDQFIAIGFEKSQAAKDWEDTDYFNLIVVTKAEDQQYYFSKIEHPADILSPKHANDDIKINWLKETTKSTAQELISDLYCLIDSRAEYTLTIDQKPYSIYEKYLAHSISVSYEIWQYYDSSNIEVLPVLRVRCQLESKYYASALDYLPVKTLEYPINIYSLLQTSVFQYRPFKIWYGDVDIDGIKVRLKSKF